ncbi:MAG: PAS domain-containing protein [Bacteroidota bacterium]|nr:PAS domain-containing protein [Bacteroidota bacterium]
MSEFIQNKQERIDDLVSFTCGMIEGRKGGELIEQYRKSIEAVSPALVVAMVDRIMQMEYATSGIKKGINKALNVFYKKLDERRTELPEEKHFLYYLIKENQAMDERMKAAKDLIKRINREEDEHEAFENLKSLLLQKVKDFAKFDAHYVKKENILFPYLERMWPDYRCVKLMWSYHDDIRESWKRLQELLLDKYMDLVEFNEEIGRFYFLVYTIMFREEAVIFPIAVKDFKRDDWWEMLQQAREIGFSFIGSPAEDLHGKPVEEMKMEDALQAEWNEESQVNLDSGSMSVQQLINLLNTLPVDITLVDEHNKVQYFSSPEKRIFPRSKAVIGRDVNNCHPPESVHIVEKLINDMRSGKKDSERFWIEMKGKFILIDYYALRDQHGKYKGVIEVTQDLTDIRKLRGRRG